MTCDGSAGAHQEHISLCINLLAFYHGLAMLLIVYTMSQEIQPIRIQESRFSGF